HAARPGVCQERKALDAPCPPYWGHSSHKRFAVALSRQSRFETKSNRNKRITWIYFIQFRVKCRMTAFDSNFSFNDMDAAGPRRKRRSGRSFNLCGGGDVCGAAPKRDAGPNGPA